LKTLITDECISLERKGKETKQIQSNICIIGVSNHSDHHMIKEGQRRIFAIECAPKPKHLEYYTNLTKVLERSADKFYSYILDIDIDDFYPSRFPENHFQKALIEDNKDTHIRFIEEYNWKYFGGQCVWENALFIHEEYRKWCKSQELKYIVPFNMFMRRSTNYLESKKFSGNITKWRRIGEEPKGSDTVCMSIKIPDMNSIETKNKIDRITNGNLVIITSIDKLEGKVIFTSKDKDILEQRLKMEFPDK